MDNDPEVIIHYVKNDREPETITISKDEYFNLKAAELELSMLEAGGVDNWDWYSESLYGDDLVYNLDYAVLRLRKEIFGKVEDNAQ
jgi:hypothetical protein